MTFADPMVVKPFADATEVGLATAISGVAVVSLLVCVLALLAWWILEHTCYHRVLLLISSVAVATVTAMAILFAQNNLASKYTGTSLRLLAADTASGGPLCDRPIAYACIYFTFVALASSAVTLGFSYLAIGASDLGLRVRIGFWASAVAGLCGVLYAGLSLTAVISGARHHLVLPFHGTETATMFALCGALIFGAGVIIPYFPLREERTS
ncbi:hypothetical protein [Streptomyces sp. NPDC057253]|uniref:hypothetical protein n=1 Tax=Streptomyces sp. NPDC057253 TaxID=3346069 RepID=UPI00362C3851